MGCAQSCPYLSAVSISPPGVLPKRLAFSSLPVWSYWKRLFQSTRTCGRLTTREPESCCGCRSFPQGGGTGTFFCLLLLFLQGGVSTPCPLLSPSGHSSCRLVPWQEQTHWVLGNSFPLRLQWHGAGCWEQRRSRSCLPCCQDSSLLAGFTLARQAGLCSAFPKDLLPQKNPSVPTL